MKLQLQHTNKNYIYHTTSANRVILGQKVEEYVNDKIFKLTIVNSSANEITFQYKLLNQRMQGRSLLHKWIAFIEKFQEDMYFTTDKTGAIIDIQKVDSLIEKWENNYKYAAKKLFKKKDSASCNLMINKISSLLNNKQSFIDSFKGYNVYRFFFQGHYQYHKTEKKVSLNNFFGKIDLPLIFTSSIERTESLDFYEIKKRGKIDRNNLNRNAFSRMLKDLTGIYNIDATIALEAEEKYIFNQSGWLQEGEMFFHLQSANYYTITNAHNVQEISNSERIKRVEEWKVLEKNQATKDYLTITNRGEYFPS